MAASSQLTMHDYNSMSFYCKFCWWQYYEIYKQESNFSWLESCLCFIETCDATGNVCLAYVLSTACVYAEGLKYPVCVEIYLFYCKLFRSYQLVREFFNFLLLEGRSFSKLYLEIQSLPQRILNASLFRRPID
jgi:hypothetical protein